MEYEATSGPVVGEFLQAVGRRGRDGARYRVVSSRRMNTRDGALRYALGIIRVDEFPRGAFIWRFSWNPRTKRR